MLVTQRRNAAPPGNMSTARTAYEGAGNTHRRPNPSTLSRSVRAVPKHTHTHVETWNPIPGWEGYYEVSDAGRVRSVSRSITRDNGRPYTVGVRVLTQYSTKSGHRCVKLYRDGEGTPYGVHRLVIAAFIGPCPAGMEVCHDNGDATDNRLSNLRYDTRAANIRDSVRHGTNHWANKTHCPRGHALEAPNLVPSTLKAGGRTCLACSRAQSYVKYHKHLKPEFKQIADSYHHSITEV